MTLPALPPSPTHAIALHFIAACHENMTPTMASHDEMYFRNVLKRISKELQPQIPSIPPEHEQLLHSSLVSVMASQATRDACKKRQDQAKTEPEKKKASEALAAAEQALTQAIDTAIKTSTPILTELQESLLQNDSLDPLLTTCSILNNATKQLAEYCKRGTAQSKLVDDLLGNVSLMRDMLSNGGAKGGNYGQAMYIYTSILSTIKQNNSNDTDILHRLALGTSLEHAVPINVFDAKKQHVDPIARYHHYEQAFLHKELDPTFSNQSTWEFRYITDSDATDEQLTWGRRMLRNYRPDIMERKDYKWRYCFIVRTDVNYCKPNWTSTPHTYDQMLAGGGKCGPRAWFGRFACKMFGIPTWGVRQPGHAAVGHWTPNGEWVTCLGAAWKFSYWENREGLDFVLEAQAREQREEYIGVCRLDWVADALGEKAINGKLNADSMWQSLALLQQHRLANVTKSSPPCNKSAVKNIMDEMGRPAVEVMETVTFSDDGTIIIPAVACSKPTKGNQKAIFMRSFLGGKQLHIREDQSVEYTLTLKESRQYQLVLKVVSVHLKMGPVNLQVTTNINDGGSKAAASNKVTVGTVIVIPYTKGEWRLTFPVEIELGAGPNVLTFTREMPNFGLTLKELILLPVNESPGCMNFCFA